MQALRIITWMLVAAIVVAVILLNSQDVAINFWPRGNGQYLNVSSGLGIVMILSFLAGLLPMWLLSRASKWRTNRRIATLENSVAASSVMAPVASSTQLEAAAPPPPPPTATPDSTL